MIKFWCMAGVVVVFLSMLLGSSYLHEQERQTWRVKEEYLVNALKVQIPQMRAKMGDLKANYTVLEYKQDYSAGLVGGSGPETVVFYSEELE